MLEVERGRRGRPFLGLLSVAYELCWWALIEGASALEVEDR